ncbi:MAG: inositol monophosphatase [Propionibacteriales bacterium]|nr:inositol monophosphatase [Propionibacteriales bacterium]
MGEPQPRDLLNLATGVAHEAGELIVRLRRTTTIEVAATKSSPTDIVTESDRASESLIRDRLHDARPADGFLGEEGGGTPGDSGVVWVVDPIDGTVNYLYGIPSYAVSIAARVDGEVAVGVVHNPVSGETWSGIRGEGAWLDGDPIQANRQVDLSRALIATGFHYDPDLRARQAAAMATLLPRVRDIRRVGAASLDLCAVGTGRVDAFAEQGLKPWDLAAGGLIAREAGATVSGLRGAEAGEQFVLAAGEGLFESLHELLVESGFGI